MASLLLLSGSAVLIREPTVVIAANAPPGADALQITALGRPITAFLTLGCPQEGKVRILKDDIVTVVPGTLAFSRCSAQTLVPTNTFVRANGQYEVQVQVDDGDLWSTLTEIRKVVRFVWPIPFEQAEQNVVRIEVALNELSAQPLTSGIITSGTLDIIIYYERCDPQARTPVPVPIPNPGPVLEPDECRLEHVPVHQAQLDVQHVASTTFFVGYEALRVDGFERAPEGYYGVEAVFHNREALGNSNVPMDPALSQAEVPLNWWRLHWS